MKSNLFKFSNGKTSHLKIQVCCALWVILDKRILEIGEVQCQKSCSNLLTVTGCSSWICPVIIYFAIQFWSIMKRCHHIVLLMNRVSMCVNNKLHQRWLEYILI